MVSKIKNLKSSFLLMTIKASVTNLLHTLIMKRNKRINGNKWAVHFKALIDNVLAFEHKYKHSLSIKARNNYKRKEQQNPKVHMNTHPKITPSQLLSKQTFSLSDLSIRVFLTNTTPMCSISFQSFLAGLHWRHDQPQDHPSTKMRISIADFSHHQFGAICGNTNYSSHLP